MPITEERLRQHREAVAQARKDGGHLEEWHRRFIERIGPEGQRVIEEYLEEELGWSFEPEDEEDSSTHV